MNDTLNTSQALSTDQLWMKEALLLAQKADSLGEVPVGAVIVRNEEIIGKGWNQPICNHDPSAHAEIMALRDAGQSQQNYRLPDSTLYVTIEPCSMCAGALIHARVSRVVFAATEPKAGAIVSQARLFDEVYLNHKVDYLGGVCEADSTQLIQAFFRRRRKEARRLKRQS